MLTKVLAKTDKVVYFVILMLMASISQVTSDGITCTKNCQAKCDEFCNSNKVQAYTDWYCNPNHLVELDYTAQLCYYIGRWIGGCIYQCNNCVTNMNDNGDDWCTSFRSEVHD